MISRLQLLRNIGQFDSVDAGATINLGRETLIYSENGRGKTTLTAILRSLATGDPIPIAERKRLAAQNAPHVVIDCTGGSAPAVFQNGAWSRTLPHMSVFDDVFVDQNVHSGLSVEVGHRQHLHELILGEQAVTLSRELQGLIEKIEAHNAALRTKSGAIPSAERGSLTVDQFCALPQQANIDEAIQEAERRLGAARQQEAIRTTSTFEELVLPAFDLPSLESVLGQNLPALDPATLTEVQSHISHLGAGGEAWVADGMARVHPGEEAEGSKCPFCAQDLEGSSLFDHFRVFFSNAYSTLTRAVSEATSAVNRMHAGDVPAAFERAVRVVIERRQFWAQFCSIPELAVDTAAVLREWKAAREAVTNVLTKKQASPLESMAIPSAVQSIVSSYEQRRTELASLNDVLREANRNIAIVKEGAASANISALSSDVAKLKAVKARHSAAIQPLCDDYLREKAAKEATERERDQKKTALTQHRATVFPNYQAAINRYLQRFNAGFRLDSVVHADTRGGPTCSYNVLINNVPVAIGGPQDAPGTPSFRNTLSAGDRNTLALAFFFASLDQDPNLASKVLVIDDPISSLDDHRTLATAQEIRNLVQRATQVVVLSHNKPFLCRLWEAADATVRAALEVARQASGSTLQSWDVGQDCVTEHDRRHARLRNFQSDGTGDEREIARDIRPHLEAYLRVACPENFPPGRLLGPFINVCEQRTGTASEILNTAHTQELKQIVEYANKFHHDTNPAWETEVINHTELTGFVERAMIFTRP